MTNSEQVVENGTASSLIEELGKALHELQACKDSCEDRVQWSEIEEHFRSLEAKLKNKFEEIEVREKEYDEKEAQTRASLAEREEAVYAKEQEFLDRIQELKDAAVAVIAEARANYQPTSLDSIDGGDIKDNKVSSSLGETNSSEEYSPHKLGENTERVATDVKPRPELMQLCEQMDAKGLLGWLVENQKYLYSIRKELSVALESAAEPARLVLDMLEGFYPPADSTEPKGKRDPALQGMRRSCVVFMEAMAALLAKHYPGPDHLLNPEIKQQAKVIADEWKPKLAIAGIDATNGISLEADAFLQLLSTYRISSEFDEEELCKLVLIIARSRQAPERCRSLGLTHKMPGVIESLINSGKQIEAVRFIRAFQLAESFPIVPLLKTFLKDKMRSLQGSGDSSTVAGVQSDANAQELAALRAVIRCIEECKLQAEYPLDPLQRRVAELKSKVEKNRVGDFGKHQKQKKQRANGGYRGFRGGAAVSGTTGGRQQTLFAERTAHPGMPDRYPHAGPNLYNYQVPSQSAYGQQATDQRMYYYPQDDIVTASSYSANPSNYSSYLGSGMRSSQKPYM
uniref:FRIGIDA-like protein n=1 Tax=Rhizophora mucronata TaxID=61149 RepID=A0A2P2JJ57_RHIMU